MFNCVSIPYWNEIEKKHERKYATEEPLYGRVSYNEKDTSFLLS